MAFPAFRQKRKGWKRDDSPRGGGEEEKSAPAPSMPPPLPPLSSSSIQAEALSFPNPAQGLPKSKGRAARGVLQEPSLRLTSSSRAPADAHALLPGEAKALPGSRPHLAAPFPEVRGNAAQVATEWSQIAPGCSARASGALVLRLCQRPSPLTLNTARRAQPAIIHLQKRREVPGTQRPLGRSRGFVGGA